MINLMLKYLYVSHRVYITDKIIVFQSLFCRLVTLLAAKASYFTLDAK